MKSRHDMNHPQLTTLGLAATVLLTQFLTPVAQAQVAHPSSVKMPVETPTQPLRVVVNSSQDGPALPDDGLTLREAIEVVNGALAVSQLSPSEQDQITPLGANAASEISFNLPTADPIRLAAVLPAIATPGLTIDGATQPGYDPSQSATAEIEIPIPVVAITPAEGAEVFRGLTIVADNVTVRGLSLYGFTSDHRATESTPPADIFIAHRLPPPDTSQQRTPAAYFPFYDDNTPPQGILIEHNWLGMTPTGEMPEPPSAFGVSVFNSRGATIRRNRISHHDGSGIITGARAENLQVTENIIVGNGLAGMPDGIRLEGRIGNGLINGNLVCGNDGGGIFLFKPEGSVEIRDNDIKFNGQRLRRAAVYLMGNNHQVVDNTIINQKGPGVVVTAFTQGGNTQSQRNLIRNNRFNNLEGLSIDLNTRRHSYVQAFQRGDGPNPVRNSGNRRRETGNAAINAPQFYSPEFFVLNDRVVVEGVADPGAEIDLYLTQGDDGEYGPLNQPLATVPTDEDGYFSFASTELQAGDRVSAIATDPRYGTSEPALNTVVRSLDPAVETLQATSLQSGGMGEMPQCTTPPEPVAAQPPPPEPLIPESLQLQVPRNVHFGLDRDTISPASSVVLDQIATVLRQYPTLVVDLHGHTDYRASNAYNQDLALRRARHARQYLLQQGIDPSRMTIRSLGETQLLSAGNERLDHARNRRVEFIFQDVRGIDITFVDQEIDLQLEP